jgi:hypothetical protein
MIPLPWIEPLDGTGQPVHGFTQSIIFVLITRTDAAEHGVDEPQILLDDAFPNVTPPPGPFISLEGRGGLARVTSSHPVRTYVQGGK